MNHRTGKLLACDFEESGWQRPRSFFISKPEHTSDFGQLNIPRHWHQPAPVRPEYPRRLSQYGWLAALIVSLLVIAYCLAAALDAL